MHVRAHVLAHWDAMHSLIGHGHVLKLAFGCGVGGVFRVTRELALQANMIERFRHARAHVFMYWGVMKPLPTHGHALASPLEWRAGGLSNYFTY